jgi:hypothetical protein
METLIRQWETKSMPEGTTIGRNGTVKRLEKLNEEIWRVVTPCDQ